MMPKTATTGRHWSLGFEVLLALVVVGSVAWAGWRLGQDGLLPQPFFWVVSDTLMDWHNPAYWAHNSGAYEVWRSVYPPLSFVFLKVFSTGACYVSDPFAGRDCDRWGQMSLVGFYLLNAVLLYRHFRTVDPRTALIRTVVLVVGMPMLFGLERGNLIIPCFTAFILGHSRLLKSARARWVAQAFAINFKPYLVLTLIPFLVRRRWRWFEGAGIATLAVYLVTLVLIGGGTPMEIARHTGELAALQTGSAWSDLYYATSYAPLVRFMTSDFPVMEYVGSRPVEALTLILPLLTLAGQIAVVAAVGTAWLRQAPVPMQWMNGAICAMILSSSQPSAYAQIFMLFFVFMEPWKGPTRIMMLVGAYALSLVGDYALFDIPQLPMESWLGGREVLPSVGVALGQFIRPGLVLLIQFGFAGLILQRTLRPERLAIESETIASSPMGVSPSSPTAA
jgi:hypothetical protein